MRLLNLVGDDNASLFSFLSQGFSLDSAYVVPSDVLTLFATAKDAFVKDKFLLRAWYFLGANFEGLSPEMYFKFMKLAIQMQ